MVKHSKVRPVPHDSPDLDEAEDPVDDVRDLGVVAGSQAASGLPQGITAVVIVYAVVRLAGLLVRFLRSGTRTRP